MGDYSTAMDTVPENWTNGSDLHDLGDYDDYFDPSFQLQQMLSQPAQVIAWAVGILGIVANLWALLAVFHVRGGLSLHYKLIASLTASDLFISLSVLLHHMRGIFIQVGHPVMYNMSYCVYMFTKALNTTSLNISLLNLMAMALDHYLAILRPLHYPTMMTSARVNLMIGFLWISAMVLGFSDFYSTAGFDYKSEHNQTLHYCKQVWLTKYQDEYTMFFIALLCFFIMVFVYGRIYMETRKHMKRTPQFQEMVKNKKALITTLLILGTFMLCWLPTSLFQIALIIQVHVDRKKVVSMQAALLVADPYLLDLLLLNSVLDPLIYAIRIREIRFAYKKLCYHCCRCCMKRPRRTASPDFNTTHCTMLLEERKNSVSSFKSNYITNTVTYIPD